MPADNGNNRILTKMLDRLLAALASGPSLNCRPHSSRQRMDWSMFGGFNDQSAEDALRAVLGPGAEARLIAKVSAPRPGVLEKSAEELSPEEKTGIEAWEDQLALLAKLRGITEDARTYEQDTGVHVLNIGFPLLTLPPTMAGKAQRGPGRRIMAPIAFVPVTVMVKSGAGAGVVIACKGEGVDRVIPNSGLLAWLEQQTGRPEPDDLFEDEEGANPWGEICALVRHVCEVLEIQVPGEFLEERKRGKEKGKSEEVPAGTDSQSESVDESNREPTPVATGHPSAEAQTDKETRGQGEIGFTLVSAPKAEETPDKPAIHLCAILGLFPMANQGLLRDMQAMVGGEAVAGPITSFIHANVNLDAPAEPAAATAEQPAAAAVQPAAKRVRSFADERFVAPIDPCQARAVRLARKSRALVVHGPPGTGKSQTITNIIGDHLSRGQRVLLVSDKRTALDVVANRLEHMGLSSLAALIHDPQRDQRDLYRAIRERLESLAEAQTNEKAAVKLNRIDAELQQLHGELTDSWQALMGKSEGIAFHDLVGQWLSIGASAEFSRVESLGDAIKLDELERNAHPIDETLRRAARVRWWENPWRMAAGVDVQTFLAVPMDKWRQAMARCVELAGAADATQDPAIPPFVPQVDLKAQGQARTDLAARFERAMRHVSFEVRRRWASRDEPAQTRMHKRLVELGPLLATMRSGSLDAELTLTARDCLPSMPELAVMLGELESYLEVASSWHAFLHFKRKAAARPILQRFGLPLDFAAAQRLKTFLSGLRTRLVLQAIHYELYQVPAAIGLLSDEALDRTLGEHRELLELLSHMRSNPALAGLIPQVVGALQEDAKAGTLLQGLRASAPRAAALAALNESLASSRLFDGKWLANFDAEQRRGFAENKTPDEPAKSGLCAATPVIQSLSDHLPDVESILRMRAGLTSLPPGIMSALLAVVRGPFDPAAAHAAVRKTALAATITRRLRSDPRLAAVDAHRIGSIFDRYRKLEEDKRDLVRDAIIHQWVARQKERLLAATGSRLNSMGADLKRRLTLRGERAMRLRQVLAHGQNIEGGDPLFDLCPVWMASPETVAQLFARREVFAVVVFDEASQCRLEETLPVLTRATRVVIAGDPKQLPPTRFFESAVAQSEDEEVESEQQLFEAQQGEIEDLLGAALNIEIDEAYLDVHYRSRASELIEFSNEHFYNSRLQAIPGHPSNRPEAAPLVLHRIEGVYEKRRNEIEAQAVAGLVQELLRPRTPPSIGIACFNLQQRDLILDKLDELAAADERFAAKLESARNLAGEGSFEGLFVKNLENVQGDERDVIIISTTYGPDPSGRFYRRFGPLGKAGGGRRLNVLVTRARQAVHLVTSIPPEIYRALPPVPQGQQPSGGWLLFAYLKYAEQVAKGYEEERQRDKAARGQGEGERREDEEPALGLSKGGRQNEEKSTSISQDSGVSTQDCSPRVHPTHAPSVFAEALARHLGDVQKLSSDVYWGNDGFCVDVALQDGNDVTLGLLCDPCRFAGAEDPVEWDVFRTTIHESQGWKLKRIFSPHFFRDPSGLTEEIVKEAKANARL